MMRMIINNQHDDNDSGFANVNKNQNDRWFGTWILFSAIVGMMIQSDFHIFQGVGILPIR